MKFNFSTLSIGVFVFYSSAVYANSTPPTQTQNLYTYPTANANANAQANSSAGIQGNILGSGNVSASYAILGNPSIASNLPGYVCPLGDSISWSIGWNFFSYARSSTRTEMECLEKVLAGMRVSTPPVSTQVMIPYKGEQIHPTPMSCEMNTNIDLPYIQAHAGVGVKKLTKTNSCAK